MTALVLENLSALPAIARSLRMLLVRLAQELDALVSARAARQVPEWQMRQVQSEINRHLELIRVGRVIHNARANSRRRSGNSSRYS